MIKKIILFSSRSLVLMTFFLVEVSYSKPMMPPDLDEAVSSSEVIIVGEYIKCTKGWKKVDYFEGVATSYKVVEILKGEAVLGEISVRHDFDDGTACLIPERWVFNDNMLPRKGSRWILFLQGKDPPKGIWRTYRGNYGRWELTNENLKKIQQKLKE